MLARSDREATARASTHPRPGDVHWAFIVCFAVWLMFGVIGIRIKKELGLNGRSSGFYVSTPS